MYPASVIGRNRRAILVGNVEKPLPCSGMPLGGIDTGALYLEPSGVLGYSSIFKSPDADRRPP